MTQAETTTAKPDKPALTEEQQSALTQLVNWLKTSDPEDWAFVLKGYAGTGKTYLIKELVNQAKGRFIFTAPTNKATKVLRESVTTKTYQPEVRTIYSLLGLRLEATGEIKELSVPEDPLDISQYRAIIVDEGSMVNAQVLAYIKKVSRDFAVKFIFMGDPAQLPPVKELTSPIWKFTTGAELTKVMRHDNQILELATRIRGVVNHPAPSIKLLSANDGDEGVWKLSEGEFEARILERAAAGDFSKPYGSKAIAWRNVSVDRLNKLIRDRIFHKPASPWLVEDRIIFTAPAKDLDDEIVATTDDEGTITRVEEEYHALHGEFKIYRVSIMLDTNMPVVARILHSDSQALYSQRVEELAAAARSNKRLWKKFWDFKDCFHTIRHAYAITAHRSQGSTYDEVFLDWRDVLVNINRQEAYRCLYVGATRPKKRLFLN